MGRAVVLLLVTAALCAGVSGLSLRSQARTDPVLVQKCKQVVATHKDILSVYDPNAKEIQLDSLPKERKLRLRRTNAMWSGQIFKLFEQAVPAFDWMVAGEWQKETARISEEMFQALKRAQKNHADKYQNSWALARWWNADSRRAELDNTESQITGKARQDLAALDQQMGKEKTLFADTRRLGRAFLTSMDIALGRIGKSIKSGALQPLGIKKTDKIFAIKYSGSDPHGHFESVLMLDIGPSVTDLTRVVYKPSSVDGHYFLQGHEESLVKIMNSLVDDSFKLPLMKVIRQKDGGVSYGFLEFIRGGGEGKHKVDFQTNQNDFQVYSQRAGMLAAAAYLIGLDDLHLENIMATTAGPVAIDAESAFRPDAAFKLTSTLLFSGDGAFNIAPQNIQALMEAGKSPNSVVTYNGVFGHRPSKVEFRAGFAKALDVLTSKESAEALRQWIKAVYDADAVTRVIIVETGEAKMLRKYSLTGTPCDQLANGQLNVDVKKWEALALAAMYEQKCARLVLDKNSKDDKVLSEAVSIPAYFAKVNFRKMFYPSMGPAAALRNLPAATMSPTVRKLSAGRNKQATENVFAVSGFDALQQRVKKFKTQNAQVLQEVDAAIQNW